jgi:hypothetical protein
MIEFNLSLLCPSTLEEKLLDVLLMLPQAVVFTSTPIAAHGLISGRLNVMEQVLGRALVTQVQVLLSATDKDDVLSMLQRDFAGVGVRYWIMPVTQEGEIV